MRNKQEGARSNNEKRKQNKKLMTILRIWCLVAMLALASSKDQAMELLMSNEMFSVKAVYIDNTETVHMLYGTSYAHNIKYAIYNTQAKPQFMSWHLEDRNITNFFSAHLASKKNSSVLYGVFNGLRRCGLQRCFDLWTSETSKENPNWSRFQPVPRDNLGDNCHRYGDSIIFTDAQLFVFYHLECPQSSAKLCFVSRMETEANFSRESVIVEDFTEVQIRPSVTAEWTKQDTMAVVHVFWAASNSTGSMVMYTNSTDRGQSWSRPRKISGNDNYSGMRMLTSISNGESYPTWLLGTYGVSPSGPLRLFSSNDHGATFSLRPGTTQIQDRYSWEYNTNAMCIGGNNSRPMMFALTQTHESKMEFNKWELLKMTRNQQSFPLPSGRAFGVQLACATTKMKNYFKIAFYVFIPWVKDDKKVYLEMSYDEHYQFPTPSS